MKQDLHMQRPTERFSGRAGDYAKYRPSYPAGAIDAVLAGLGEPSGLVAADVGAGTGISARLLAERGVRVIAVEPNRQMREAGQGEDRRGAAGHPKHPIQWSDGTAEATGLAEASVDLVLCAQAFHWFRPEESLREFHRVLRPGGRVALLWNDRDDTDPATAEYGRLIREASENHPATSHAGHHRALEQSQLFTGFRRVEVRGGQSLDLQGLLGRARSASYVPKEGPAWDRLANGLGTLHARFADAQGWLSLAYQSHIYLAEATD